MLNNRIKSIKNYNYDLVMGYLANYESINQMYTAYKNYSSMILSWADNRDLLKAPTYKSSFSDYLKDKSIRNGKEYSDNYIYSACLFARDFFRYCKAVLPEEDTESLTEFWMKNIVPGRISSQRLSLSWITDEDLLSVMNFKTDERRLRRAQTAILLTALTGMSRVALLSIPIKEIDFTKLLVYQYPERGVYTEKLVSGTTHIFPDMMIVEYLQKFTDEMKSEVPEDSTWYMRLSRHGKPLYSKFGPVTLENKKEAYAFATAPYGKLKEDMTKISNICKIPRITMSIAQNTFIKKCLRNKIGPNIVNEISQDLLFRSSRPVKQCIKLLEL